MAPETVEIVTGDHAGDSRLERPWPPGGRARGGGRGAGRRTRLRSARGCARAARDAAERPPDRPGGIGGQGRTGCMGRRARQGTAGDARWTPGSSRSRMAGLRRPHETATSSTKPHWSGPSRPPWSTGRLQPRESSSRSRLSRPKRTKLDAELAIAAAKRVAAPLTVYFRDDASWTIPAATLRAAIRFEDGEHRPGSGRRHGRPDGDPGRVREGHRSAGERDAHPQVEERQGVRLRTRQERPERGHRRHCRPDLRTSWPAEPRAPSRPTRQHRSSSASSRRSSPPRKPRPAPTRCRSSGRGRRGS